MSTGAECSFKELPDNRWQYWLQEWPYGDSPDGETYGPFPTFSAAREHLGQNHANPGGWTVDRLPDGQHAHEWVEGSVSRPSGIRLEIEVRSLGPDVTREQAVDFVKTLPSDHPAWRSWPVNSSHATLVCDSCHREKT